MAHLSDQLKQLQEDSTILEKTFLTRQKEILRRLEANLNVQWNDVERSLIDVIIQGQQKLDKEIKLKLEEIRINHLNQVQKEKLHLIEKWRIPLIIILIIIPLYISTMWGISKGADWYIGRKIARVQELNLKIQTMEKLSENALLTKVNGKPGRWIRVHPERIQLQGAEGWWERIYENE